MPPYVDVAFPRAARDRALEGAVHRWVARFEAMGIEVRRATVTIELASRRRTSVSLAVMPADGVARAAAVVHVDAYVAISEAFRVVRRQVIEHAAAGGAAARAS